MNSKTSQQFLTLRQMVHLNILPEATRDKFSQGLNREYTKVVKITWVLKGRTLWGLTEAFSPSMPAPGAGWDGRRLELTQLSLYALDSSQLRQALALLQESRSVATMEGVMAHTASVTAVFWLKHYAGDILVWLFSAGALTQASPNYFIRVSHGSNLSHSACAFQQLREIC